MPAFRVKLGTNDLNCVDVMLNPTHSLIHSLIKCDYVHAGGNLLVQNVFCQLFQCHTILPMYLRLFRSELKGADCSDKASRRALHHSLKATSRAGVRGILGHFAMVGFCFYIILSPAYQFMLKDKRLKLSIALNGKPITELRSVTLCYLPPNKLWQLGLVHYSIVILQFRSGLAGYSM